MLKKIAIILAILITIIGVFMIFFVKKTDIQSGTAILTYNYADKSICIELSQEESEKLKNILNKKWLTPDNLSCGFTKDISISFGEQVFCIARDTCAVVKLDNSNKYLNISVSDREEIEKIFKKYGGTFPCV